VEIPVPVFVVFNRVPQLVNVLKEGVLFFYHYGYIRKGTIVGFFDLIVKLKVHKGADAKGNKQSKTGENKIKADF
jgi:hypothetical protein